MDDLRLRARAAGGWLCCAVLIGVLGSTPVTAAKKPKTQSVQVVNTIDAPGLIQDVATAEPVQVGATRGLEPGVQEANQDLPYVVPVGRRLIVRAVTVTVAVPIGQSVLIAVGDSTSPGQYVVPAPKQGTLGAADWFAGVTPHYLIFEAGQTPAFTVARSSSTGSGIARVHLHGSLVPLVPL